MHHYKLLSLLPFIFYLVCHHFCSDTVMRHELLIVYANVSEFKIIQVMIFAQFCCQRFIYRNMAMGADVFSSCNCISNIAITNSSVCPKGWWYFEWILLFHLPHLMCPGYERITLSVALYRQFGARYTTKT